MADSVITQKWDILKADFPKICEICGEVGELRPDNWIRTLCDNHAPKGEIK